MYCIQCGVQLADTEKECPLCHTRVFHPDLSAQEGEPLFPPQKSPKKRIGSRWPQIIASAALLLPLLIVLACDLQTNHTITWSGFVIGGLVNGYAIFVLPAWFERPNPVIFVPCSFAAGALYLLYINLATGGSWFLTFALPLVGGLALITSAVVTLLWYLRKGKLYIFGGAFIALGGFMLPMELLMNLTFQLPFIGWSLYPLITLTLLGGLLIFLAICRPARETMERKLFI